MRISREYEMYIGIKGGGRMGGMDETWLLKKMY
jgi:hypothetical protein